MGKYLVIVQCEIDAFLDNRVYMVDSTGNLAKYLQKPELRNCRVINIEQMETDRCDKITHFLKSNLEPVVESDSGSFGDNYFRVTSLRELMSLMRMPDALSDSLLFIPPVPAKFLEPF